MKKLLYAAVGATVTLLSASTAFAQSVQGDMATAIQNRDGINRELSDLARRTAGTTVDADGEAVLGVQALPVLGMDGPMQLKLDMLTALRDFARKNRGLADVTPGGSTD